VFRAFESWVGEQKDVPYVLKEAALLFESDAYKMCDQSILVKSTEALKFKRIMVRDQITLEEVRLRMDRQFSDEKKEKMADHLITNNEQLLLIPQILALHKHFIQMFHDH
jgi:dephospho-CoA kinase